jgi:putative iron-regulated protein
MNLNNLKTMKTNHLLFALFTLVLSIQSCKKDDKDPNAALKESIKSNYADIVSATYEDTYNKGVELKTAIDAFVANPTSQGFDDAKTAWKAAREPYGQTEAFRFSNGPIDAGTEAPEGLINGWPLDEVYIDNIIAGTDNLSDLENLNEAGGEKNISVGYHAIEYLLWGADNTAPSALIPGQRPFTDYVGNGTTETRRRQYLQTVTNLLVGHLEYLKNQWSSGVGTYRTTFLALDNNVALTNILTGIGVLSKSELAGERIYTAYDNQDQEDEHSCFSDNTHRDIRLNLQGIYNVYTGTYTRTNNSVISGASLSDLVTKADATLATTVTNQLTNAVARVNATGIPFDNAITDGSQRPAVLEAVYALRTLGDDFSQAGSKLGLTIDTSLPE